MVAKASRPSSEVTSNDFIIITGVGKTKSVGGASAIALLKQDPHVQLIIYGRGKKEEMHGWDSLAAEEQNRILWKETDLLDPTSIQAEVAATLSHLQGGINRRLQAVLLSYGTGYVNSDLGEKPELRRSMHQANVEGPAAIIDGLREQIQKDTRVVYVSAAFTHPALKHLAEPNVGGYIQAKEDGVAAVKRALPEKKQLVAVRITNVDGPMVTKGIKRPDAELPWLTGLPTDTYEEGSIGDGLAELLLKGLPEKVQKEFADSPVVHVLMPRLARLMFKDGEEGLKKGLLEQLQLNAKFVLEHYEIPREEYEALLKHHKDNKTLGEEFPYQELAWEKLHEANSFKARAMRWVAQNVLGLSQAGHGWQDRLLKTAPMYTRD